MPFKYKTDAEVQAMTEQEANDYAIAKRAHEADLQDSAIKEALKPVQEELKNVKENNTELALKVTELETKGVKSTVKAFEAEFKEKKEAIKAILIGGRGEVELKALTQRSSIADNFREFAIEGISPLNRRRMTVSDALPKRNITNSQNDAGVIKFSQWDIATTVAAAAMIAEGAAFPESTAKFTNTSVPIEKVGDTLVVTEEFGEDAEEFEQELTPFIVENVDLAWENQVMNGGGTSNELIGLRTIAPTYVPVASGIAFATAYDLMKSVKATIATNTKFIADVVFLNDNEFNKLTSEKDENGQYVIPPFVRFDAAGNMNVSGMDVVITSTVPDNQMVVGQRNKAVQYIKVGVTVSEGYSGTQFTSDEKTLKVRKRGALVVKTNEKFAWRSVTNITGNIATLAS